MVAWKNQLRAAELLVVSAYVGTLQGTDPPNAKSPQGAIPEPVAEPPAESDPPPGAEAAG
jgi:cytochrome c oxidase cbb3-type subunit 3